MTLLVTEAEARSVAFAASIGDLTLARRAAAIRVLRRAPAVSVVAEPTTLAAREISTVIFDFGGVISSPLFVGIGAFEEAEGYPKGSLLQLLFGETHYIGVEGRAAVSPTRSPTIPTRPSRRARSTTSPTGTCSRRARSTSRRTSRAWSRTRAARSSAPPIDMEAYGRFWRQTAPGVHWMVVHKIRELKDRGLRLGLLTNNVKEFGEHWRTMFPLDELFEEVVDSSHVGMRKPDREIYELTCSRMGIEPTEAVFIDDNADNVAAARAVRHGSRALRREPVGRARRARRRSSTGAVPGPSARVRSERGATRR